MNVIGKFSDLVHVVDSSCGWNASADDSRESVNASKIGTKRNTDKSLLCGIGEFKVFLLSYHIQIISGIFPSHTSHLMLIKPRDERAVFIISASIVKHIV